MLHHLRTISNSAASKEFCTHVENFLKNKQKCPTIKTADIRQKNGQKREVDSTKLSGVSFVSSVKVFQFNNYTCCSTIPETLIK